MLFSTTCSDMKASIETVEIQREVQSKKYIERDRESETETQRQSREK